MEFESLEAALQTPHVPMKAIIHSGVLPEQCKAVLYGTFKTGKSTLLQYVGMSIAGGLPLFGDVHFACEKSRVFYLNMEIPKKAFVTRLQASSLTGSRDVRDNFYFHTEWFLKLDTQQGFDEMEGVLDKCKPEVLIIDPLYKTITGNENSAEDLSKVFDSLDILMGRYNFSLIFSAQGRKSVILPKVGRVDMGDEELRGSTAIPAWVDSIIGIRYLQDTRRGISFNLRHGDREAFTQDVEWDRASGLYRVT